MALFKDLLPQLCTEEMMNFGTAPIVYYKGKPGYLCAWDAGLGFTWADKNSDHIEPELSAWELSLTPQDDINSIERGTPILATFGWNDVLEKPFRKLYEFGYYTEMGCVVYKQGECNMQDAAAFKLDQIRIATPEDLKEHFWA